MPLAQISRITQRLQGKSVNGRIGQAALVVAALTLLARLFAIFVLGAIAARFGTGNSSEAFFVAFALPNYLMTAISGTLNGALVPTYIEVRDRDGRDAAERLFGTIVLITMGLLALFSILTAIIAPWVLVWLGAGHSPEKMNLCHQLFFILLPTVLINGVVSLWSARLNIDEIFGAPALAPNIVNVSQLAFLYSGADKFGVLGLAVVTSIGFALQLLIVGYGMWQHRIKMWPCWGGIDLMVRRVLKQYLPVSAGSMLLLTSALVDQFMAAQLGPRNIAALSYGTRLGIALEGIAFTALGTAVLPYFSKLASSENWEGMRQTLRTYRLLIGLATFCVAALVCLCSPFIVKVLYLHGKFNSQDAALVSLIQQYAIWRVVFLALNTLSVRMISALKANHILFYGNIISVVLNFVLDYLFMQSYGVAGIALSSSVVYIVSFCYLTTALHFKLRQQEGKATRTRHLEISPAQSVA